MGRGIGLDLEGGGCFGFSVLGPGQVPVHLFVECFGVQSGYCFEPYLFTCFLNVSRGGQVAAFVLSYTC